MAEHRDHSHDLERVQLTEDDIPGATLSDPLESHDNCVAHEIGSPVHSLGLPIHNTSKMSLVSDRAL